MLIMDYKARELNIHEPRCRRVQRCCAIRKDKRRRSRKCRKKRGRKKLLSWLEPKYRMVNYAFDVPTVTIS